MIKEGNRNHANIHAAENQCKDQRKWKEKNISDNIINFFKQFFIEGYDLENGYNDKIKPLEGSLNADDAPILIMPIHIC
jgi:hypothetical protein